MELPYFTKIVLIRKKWAILFLIFLACRDTISWAVAYLKMKLDFG